MFYFVKTPKCVRKLFAPGIWEMPQTEKTIYLTFDDGPHPVITSFVLEELSKYNAKATFFCIGKNVAENPLVFKRILDEGHAVGNHTQAHLDGWKTPNARYLANIAEAKRYIDSDLFRPPYGRITRKQQKGLAQLDVPFKIILWTVLSGDFDVNITSEQCCKNVLKNLDYHKPDVVLMDIDMPIENGLQGLRNIRNSGNDVTVIMLTVFDDNERVFQAVCSGASGYILKRTSPEKIIEAIREAQSGGAPMTPSVAKQVLKLFSKPFQKSDELLLLTTREHDVLSLLVRGYSYKLAASELTIGIETLRYHIKNIYTKLHVNSKSEAVLKAIQNKII